MATAPPFFICVNTPINDDKFLSNGALCSGCLDCSITLSYTFDGTTPGTYPYEVTCTSDECDPDNATGYVTVVDSCNLTAPDITICLGTAINDDLLIAAGASTGCYTTITYDCDDSVPGNCTYMLYDDNGVCEPCIAYGTITIVGLGAAAMSNSPVCVGDEIQLFGEPDDMFYYTWNGPNGFFSSEQSPTIPGASLGMSGDYVLAVTDTNGCTNSDTVSVEVINTGCPYIFFEPFFWNFGTVKQGSHGDRTFTVSNIGCGDLHVSFMALTGPDADQFSIVSGDGAFSLVPTSDHDIVIRFQPTSPGGKIASLAIESNDCNNADTTISIIGLSLNLTSSFTFPPVAVGECGTLNFAFCNNDTVSLNLHSATFECEAFQILHPEFPVTLDPSDCVDISVEFCPPATGTYSCLITLNSDIPGDVIQYIDLHAWGCAGVGELGDVNGDGDIDVMDVLVVVNYILGKVSLEDAWCLADCNLDGFIDILDAVGLVNVILEIGTCPPMGVPKKINTSAVMGFSDISDSPAQTIEFPIYLETETEIAGLQFTLSYENDVLIPSSVPFVTDRSARMTVASAAQDGKLTVVLYSTEGVSIPAGAEPVLKVPFRVKHLDGQAETAVSFEKALVAQDCITEVPVQLISSSVKLGDLIPKEYTLFQNYPNPFNPETSIDYQVPETEYITLTIFNTLGQRVRTLVNERQGPGFYRRQWDGCNEFGQPVSSGIYFYLLTAGNFSQTKKMVLMR